MAQHDRPSKAAPAAPRNAGYTPSRDRLWRQLAAELSPSELRGIYARRFEA